MNDTQNPSGADTGAEPTSGLSPDSAVAEVAVAAPKRRRTTRKADVTAGETPATADSAAAVAVPDQAEAAAVVTAAAEPAAATPAAKRPRTRKAAAAPAVEVPVVAEAPAVEPVASAEPAPAKPKRAPRRSTAAAAETVAAIPAEPVVESVAAASPAPAPVQERPPVAAAAEASAPTADAAPAADVISAEAAVAPGSEATSVEQAAADEQAARARESTRRRRDRNRSRQQRDRDQNAPLDAATEASGESAGADDAAAPVRAPRPARPARPMEAPAAGVFSLAPEPEPVDVGARFADVISGDYDTDAGEEVEAAVEEASKRVLRPEPEAPKLHKVLAQSGIGSRRDMEQMIQDGQVTVNGEVAHLGMRITYGDQIRVAGKPVKFRIAPPVARVLAYHKPVGEVVTLNDPEGRPTVFRRLPRMQSGKWQAVGRLDLNTEGLLLFTNSGELANQLMHPRFGIEREYAVRVLGTLDEEARQRLLAGVEIEGQKAAFKSIENGGGEGVNHWYRVVITEGRNREVRKLFDTVGLAVSRLIRIRYGCVVLPRGLKRGVWVELDDSDVNTIRRLAGDAAPRGERSDRAERDERPQDRPQRGERPERAERGGDRQDNRGANRGGQPQAGRPGQGQPQGQGQGQGRGGKGPARKGASQFGGDRRDPPRDTREQREPPRDTRDSREQGDDDIPLRIPNPLEQTFDRRFATGSKRISAGFGRPSEEPIGGPRNDRKGGPKQPDPMQTSVGYIGADAYFTKPGGNRGGGGGNRSGGGGGRSGGGGRR
ncbi:MAG: 23S rRNA pseudouridine(2605) synthase RluB [Leptothrix sp. (in: b-proteobacteria)]